MPSSSARPIRFIVQFWEAVPDVSYHCGLGVANARQWACQTARMGGGQVLCEYSDGAVEQILPYGGRPIHRAEQSAA